MSVVVSYSHLSPGKGPGYSALVFDNQTEVTWQGINKALTWARAGLPAVFIGDLPSTSPYFTESGKDIASVVEKILAVGCRSRIVSLTD